MSINNKNASVNHQTHPHQEGQQNNTSSINQADAQRQSDNNNQSMSNMFNESVEQKASGTHGQSHENSIQQDERQP